MEATTGGGFYLTTIQTVGIVLTLTGCISFLYKALMNSKNETIKTISEDNVWLKAKLDKAIETNERAVGASEALVSQQKVRNTAK